MEDMPDRTRIFLALLTTVPCLAASPRGCVGSVSVGSFRIQVQPAGKTNAWLPLRRVNNIPSGYRISYQPLDLTADLKKDAKLTLVVAPKDSGAASEMTVLDPRPAGSSTEWAAPFAVGTMLLVFAPQGLDEKRLNNLVTKDPNLISALADYADQTADLEASVEAANRIEQEAYQDEGLDTRPIRLSAADQAIFSLVRALNPSASSYNPLGAGRRVGAATMSGRAVTGFFENAGGVVPGGGALPGIKQWLMPDTEFRSVFAQPAESDGMMLCAQWQQTRSRNKMAYLWAHRLVNAPAPAFTIPKENNLALGIRNALRVRLSNLSDWHLLDHVFDWRLVSDAANQGVRVALRPVFEERALELDLRTFPTGPGSYHLTGQWDWDTFPVSGAIHLFPLDDLKAARITPESQVRLVTHTGYVPVELAGADFQFVDHVDLHRPNSQRLAAVDVTSAKAAPEPQLQLGIDTDSVGPGSYLLALTRIDGAVSEVPVQVLPPNPEIANLPLRVNLGEKDQVFTLTGSRLDHISKIDCDGATVQLGPATDNGRGRQVTVALARGLRPGDTIAAAIGIEGTAAVLRIPALLQVVGARPRIKDAVRSLPQELNVALKEGELPAGSFVSFSIVMEPAEARPTLALQCKDASRNVEALKLRAGDHSPSARMSVTDDGTLFLSFDPGAVGSRGCQITVTVDVEDLGKSDPYPLGRVVRLPKIESFELTGEKAPNGYFAILKGQSLETIAKAGWDASNGLAVDGLPAPIAGEGPRQMLKLAIPWPSPSPKAPLFIWLRGEDTGRATKVTP